MSGNLNRQIGMACLELEFAVVDAEDVLRANATKAFAYSGDYKLFSERNAASIARELSEGFMTQSFPRNARVLSRRATLR